MHTVASFPISTVHRQLSSGQKKALIIQQHLYLSPVQAGVSLKDSLAASTVRSNTTAVNRHSRFAPDNTPVASRAAPDACR